MERHRISREELFALVEAGILAPSADNHHPWRFAATEDVVEVWGTEEFLAAAFHRRVLSLLSLGAVVENMRVRASGLGLYANLSLFPDPREPSLVARLELREGRAIEEELSRAIRERHTNRRFYRGPALTPLQRAQLEAELASIPGTRLVWLDEPLARRKALRLIRIAETERFREHDLHRELFAAIRFDLGWNAAAEEGLAPGTLEVERALRPAFRAIRSWRLMRSLSYLGLHHALGVRAADAPCRFSPHLGLVATTLEPLESAAVAAGRALERAWLRVTLMQMALQPLAASTLLALPGYEAVRPALRAKLADGWAEIAPGLRPLMVFRLGKSSAVSVRNRRLAPECYLRRKNERPAAAGRSLDACPKT